MRQFIGLGMGIFIGVGLGAGAVSALHAQSKSPAYLVAEVHWTNPQAFRENFGPKIRASAKAGGGPLIAAGGTSGPDASNLVALEGKPPNHVVIRRWESMDALKAWWNSPGHKMAQQIGEKYAKFRVFAVKGVNSGQ